MALRKRGAFARSVSRWNITGDAESDRSRRGLQRLSGDEFLSTRRSGKSRDAWEAEYHKERGQAW